MMPPRPVLKIIAVGFSNGANIAASLALTRPETLDGAVLMRAMVPFVPRTLPALVWPQIEASSPTRWMT